MLFIMLFNTLAEEGLENGEFWGGLGGRVPHIKSAQSGGDDAATEDQFYDQVKLFKYADCVLVCDLLVPISAKKRMVDWSSGLNTCALYTNTLHVPVHVYC